MAAQHAHAGVLSLLSRARADLSRPNNNGFPPLFVAIRGCLARMDVLEMLLDLGVRTDVEVQTGAGPEGVWTGRRIATSMGLAEVTALLDLHENVAPLVAARQRRTFAWASKALDPAVWRCRDVLVDRIGLTLRQQVRTMCWSFPNLPLIKYWIFFHSSSRNEFWLSQNPSYGRSAPRPTSRGARSVRARPGLLSATSVLHSK